MAEREPSELEACVLGLVWETGPCTAYSVRRVFLKSLTATWSGSAGAIYPLLRRLEERGLIRSSEQFTGKRASRMYTVTPRGRAALETWLSPPLTDSSIAIPVDPLRTRLRFAAALTAKQRRQLVEAARQAATEQLAQVEADCARAAANADPFELGMARGVVHTLRARCAWLDEVASTLLAGAKVGGAEPRRS